jgi:hypothetical protein
MWILVIITFTFMTDEKHMEVPYKSKEECYEALDRAAKYIQPDTIRYIGCQDAATK